MKLCVALGGFYVSLLQSCTDGLDKESNSSEKLLVPSWSISEIFVIRFSLFKTRFLINFQLYIRLPGTAGKCHHIYLRMLIVW